MRSSESIDKLAEALSAAQAEFASVQLNKSNPHFKSKYADLSAIREATKDPLSKHGIALLQSPSWVDGRVSITTKLLHKSGQWIEGELSIKPERGDTPQAIGSAITYGRRYGLSAMLGIVADEDDDAEGSMKPRPQPAPQARPVFRAGEKRSLDWLQKGLAAKFPDASAETQAWMIKKLDGREIGPGLIDAVMHELHAEG